MKGKAFKFCIINCFCECFYILNLISFRCILLLAPYENHTTDHENGGTDQKYVPEASEGVVVTLSGVVINRVYIETSDDAEDKEQ